MLGWVVTAARSISQRDGGQGGCCEPNCSGPCQLDVSIPGKPECTIISSKSECTFPRRPRRRPASAPRSTPLTARQPATLPTAREPAAPADRTRTDLLPPAASAAESDRLPPAASEVGPPIGDQLSRAGPARAGSGADSRPVRRWPWPRTAAAPSVQRRPSSLALSLSPSLIDRMR